MSRFVAFRPDVTAVVGAHELRRDSQAIAGFSNGAFEQHRDVQIAADRADIGRRLQALAGRLRRDA
jgi:hypothetical protein